MPRAPKPDIEPGNVPLDDEPTSTPKRGRGRPPGSKTKKATPAPEPKKEAEPKRSHHKKPGPSLDQVKAGLAVVGGLAQNGIAYITIDKTTGRSPVERIALSEEELDRAANVLGERLARIPTVANAFAVIANVSKASPLAREAVAIAAPRLARLGLLPPTVAKMLGVSAEDIQAGIAYRQESIARDKMRRAQPRGGMPPQGPTADPRDRVPQREPVVETFATVDDRPLPNVGVPPEAYRARGTEVAPMEPSPSPRGSGGADSLSGT